MHITRHRLETSVQSPVIRGKTVALSHSSIFIGSESGLVLRYPTHRSHFNQCENTSALAHATLRWEKSAVEIIRQLPLIAQKDVCRHVETWAINLRKKYINAYDIFASKPKPHTMYPNPTGEVTEFEPHATTEPESVIHTYVSWFPHLGWTDYSNYLFTVPSTPFYDSQRGWHIQAAVYFAETRATINNEHSRRWGA